MDHRPGAILRRARRGARRRGAGDRHRRPVFALEAGQPGRRVRDHHRQLARPGRRPPRPRADPDQGRHGSRRRPQGSGQGLHPRLRRGLAQTAQDRPHRPLPVAHRRSHRSARRDPRRLRPAHPPGQGARDRRLELQRGPPRPRAGDRARQAAPRLLLPAAPLQPARTRRLRSRARTPVPAGEPRRHPVFLPRQRLPHRQIPRARRFRQEPARGRHGQAPQPARAAHPRGARRGRRAHPDLAHRGRPRLAHRPPGHHRPHRQRHHAGANRRPARRGPAGARRRRGGRAHPGQRGLEAGVGAGGGAHRFAAAVEFGAVGERAPGDVGAGGAPDPAVVVDGDFDRGAGARAGEHEFGAGAADGEAAQDHGVGEFGAVLAADDGDGVEADRGVDADGRLGGGGGDAVDADQAAAAREGAQPERDGVGEDEDGFLVAQHGRAAAGGDDDAVEQGAVGGVLVLDAALVEDGVVAQDHVHAADALAGVLVHRDGVIAQAEVDRGFAQLAHQQAGAREEHDLGRVAGDGRDEVDPVGGEGGGDVALEGVLDHAGDRGAGEQGAVDREGGGGAGFLRLGLGHGEGEVGDRFLRHQVGGEGFDLVEVGEEGARVDLDVGEFARGGGFFRGRGGFGGRGRGGFGRGGGGGRPGRRGLRRGRGRGRGRRGFGRRAPRVEGDGAEAGIGRAVGVDGAGGAAGLGPGIDVEVGGAGGDRGVGLGRGGGGEVDRVGVVVGDVHRAGGHGRGAAEVRPAGDGGEVTVVGCRRGRGGGGVATGKVAGDGGEVVDPGRRPGRDGDGGAVR